MAVRYKPIEDVISVTLKVAIVADDTLPKASTPTALVNPILRSTDLCLTPISIAARLLLYIWHQETARRGSDIRSIYALLTSIFFNPGKTNSFFVF
jgi:hypothetical protein